MSYYVKVVIYTLYYQKIQDELHIKDSKTSITKI